MQNQEREGRVPEQAVQGTWGRRSAAGPWIDGLIGVAIFSASLAATRLALSGMDALPGLAFLYDWLSIQEGLLQLADA